MIRAFFSFTIFADFFFLLRTVKHEIATTENEIIQKVPNTMSIYLTLNSNLDQITWIERIDMIEQ